MSNPGRRRGAAGSKSRRNRWSIVLAGAGLTLVAAVALTVLIGEMSGGTNSTSPPSSTADDANSKTEAPTVIFDRGGPEQGVQLGRLTIAGMRDSDMRAPLFIDSQVEPRLVRMCEAGWLPSPAPGQDCIASVHTSGYQVTTTLDWSATERAAGLLREAIQAGLQAGCDCHDGAIVTIEPQSGEVLVYVPNQGSLDTEDSQARPQIDQLVEINTPGSAFMPITFLAWLDRLSKAPMSTLWDTNPLQIPEGGTIANPRADGGSEGLISARAALGAMQEVPAVRASEEVGIDAVLDMAAKLGITTLAQNFDPNWSDHSGVTYGPSLGSAGVNIRAIDMAYADATIANMGEMVGTPTLARTFDVHGLPDTSTSSGGDYDEAIRQGVRFLRGDFRLPGTRALDPIVVLEVTDRDGKVLFSQGPAERQRVVDAGSAWLLHSIMSDCTARYIIWGCGSSNRDLALDFTLSDGRLVPAGVQFGRIAFPFERAETLEVWMTGYSRYAATVAWVGNSDNSAVNDRVFASSNSVVRLWKAWMGSYHDTLHARGLANIQQFEELQPANVKFGPFRSTTTDRDQRPGASNAALCDQVVDGWFRTDVQYHNECESIVIDARTSSPATPETPSAYRAEWAFRSLPTFAPASAEALAKRLGIPTAKGLLAGN